MQNNSQILIPGIDARLPHGGCDKPSMSGFNFMNSIIPHWKNLTLECLSEEYEGELRVEEWKDVVGFEKKYQVSNFGRVKTLNQQNRGYPKVLELQMGKRNGRYLLVQMYKNNKAYTFSVHRLIAKHFVPNPDNLPEVNHIKGIKIDNRSWMLEWCTRGYNIRHAADVLFVNTGIDHFRSKLSEKDVLDIFYSSGTERRIADKYKVSHSVVGFIKRKKSYKKILKNHFNNEKVFKKAPLSQEAVIQIYKTTLPINEACEIFSIGRGTYYDIKKGKRWKEIINSLK